MNLFKGDKFRLILIVLLLLFAFAGRINAAPKGGEVTAGKAEINHQQNTTDINQSTDKAAINWQSFDVNADEMVNFNQPGVNSITLNRVIGNERSVINGALNANGQVWVLNSNGVLFGKDASVNTSGLIASTKELNNQDFMEGNYNFKGSSEEGVINKGRINIKNSGYAALLGKEVINKGLIKAELGEVHLKGGKEFSLNLNGNSLVNLRVEKGELNALVENKEAIRANGGKVYLTTNAVDELLKGVVNNEGIVEAQTIADVTGEKNEGKVEIFAHGGTANVGGKLTTAKGEGFIETSGKKFNITKDAKIISGHWLIDPVDITIGTTLANTIGDALESADVTITTEGNNNPDTSSGETSGSGDITINADIIKSSGSETELTLAAHRDIILNYSNIKGSSGSPLNVVLASRAFAGNDESILGDVLIKGDIITYGGDIIIGGGDLEASGYAVASEANSNSNKGGVKIGAKLDATGNASGTADSTIPGTSVGGNITIKGKGNTNASQTNWGMQIKYGSIITGGDGDITIEGYGGTSSDYFWSVASSGVTIESNSYIKSNTGNVIIKGYAGDGYDQYGLTSTESSKLIGSNGYVLFEGDSLMIRNGTLTFFAGEDSDIKAPIIGTTGEGGGDYGLTKNGTGILNLWGNAQKWNNNRPANTASTPKTGTFSDQTDSVNIVSPTTADQALYAFDIKPDTVNQVDDSTATGSTEPDVTTLEYYLGDVIAGEYKGDPYYLKDLYSSKGIFGSEYDNLELGTDYVIKYNGSEVTGFTEAGKYSDLLISFNNQDYTVADSGNQKGSVTINKANLLVTAKDYTKVYNGDSYNGGNGVEYSGFVSGESSEVLEGSLSYSGDSQGAVNAGQYTIIPQGLSSDNYNITFKNGRLKINPRSVTVAVDDKEKLYGERDPKLTYSIAKGSIINNDDLGVDLVRKLNKDVNKEGYPIINDGEFNDNYNVTFKEGRLYILADRTVDNITSEASKITNKSNSPIDERVVSVYSGIKSKQPEISSQREANLTLTSTPIKEETTKKVYLSEIKSDQRQNSQFSKKQYQKNQSQRGENSKTKDVVVQEVRVSVSKDSLVKIVNGGVSLPEGIDQIFYIINK
ncbi:MBG domain-containing protein [Sporohalobacter salinus]|uniref:two-partner secretion domain-containing protein n=1 Tax=Sporohalobacter salinus TaxID=1494606 RepID=UPI0019621422|nr:MBG domain-containing protein [Sporohalobacter salinus]MBM7624512.1 filamentous hemagglutinin family protein [Sporohalobacter salinus]